MMVFALFLSTKAFRRSRNRTPPVLEVLFAIAGLASGDGRVTILMPHPERVFRSVQNSWRPDGAGEDSGWMRMFRNARVWVG